MPDLQIGTIVLAPVIVALVAMARGLGMDVKYAPWLCGALSLVGYGLVVLVDLVPGSLQIVTYVLNGLVIFLAATGFYDRVQSLRRSV
jgi:hypothetical protein